MIHEPELWYVWLRRHEPLTPSERSELMSFWISGGCDPDGPMDFRQKDACAQELYDAAVEIANDDQGFREAGFESFCDVMWTSDDDMNRHGLDRDQFRLCLQGAWEKLPR